MGSLHSSDQPGLNVEFEYPSPVLLLERGLRSVREGRYAEGVVYFTLAREQLGSSYIHLATVLDAFTQGYIAYWDAQQGLQEASKRFVQVDVEQQSRIVTLQTLLPALVEEAQAKSPAMDQPAIKNQNPLPHPALRAPL